MSQCLGPPLSVYSSPLVTCSSPLVIYSCRLLDAFIIGLFKCFIHMYNYFFLHLNIWSQQFHNMLVYFSWKCFSKHFFMQMVDYMFYTQPFLFMGVRCYLSNSILLNVLWHLVAHQLSIIFHFIGISTFILWTAFFHCVSPYFLISTYFFIVYSSFLTNLFF